MAGLHVHCLAEGAQVGGWMGVLLVFLGLVDHCNRTGQAFDVGRTSDFDIALKSPELLRKAESLGVGLRSGGARTGPLSMRDLKALGLNDLASQLTKQVGRDVSFMIYGSTSSAISRAPSLILPK